MRNQLAQSLFDWLTTERTEPSETGGKKESGQDGSRAQAAPRTQRMSMLICHCNGVSDRTVRRVVREGARTVSEVGHACGAGTCCRGCSGSIGKIIRAERHQHERQEETATVRPEIATLTP
jgi:bacterioferritin-associated ferredoxin